MVKNSKTKNITIISLCVALISIFSQLSIPTPYGVPLTMQVFAITLIATILNTKQALLCITIYIILGIIGIPVFANFSGGIMKLLGPTGGYIYGYYIITIFFSHLEKKKNFKRIALIIIALLLFHFSGSLHYHIVMKSDWIKSIIVISLPYLFKDFLSVIFAHILGIKLKSYIKDVK